jgi:NifB/MoaA-like Fe-S oxidoreductase
MVRVARVAEGSIADEIGIVPGTDLVTVNGRALSDFLDWEFLTADDELVIEAKLPNGEDVIYDIERPEGEALGVELEPPTVRRCANRCEFCFIEGLPKGLRNCGRTSTSATTTTGSRSRTAISPRSRT